MSERKQPFYKLDKKINDSSRNNGSLSRIRTYDQVINSHLLYR